jgi:hypothetical protein
MINLLGFSALQGSFQLLVPGFKKDRDLSWKPVASS